MTLVFYDGVCALCNGLVTFLLKRDRARTFRFAPLQGNLARELLVPAGIDPDALASMVVVRRWQTPEQQILVRSAGVLSAIGLLGGVWGAMARAAVIVPRPIADAFYSAIARSRYKVFGKFDVCPIPPPEWRDRFVE
jgi:predicted DCC family thiol-disulfide oxidoreductase YuxK